MFYSSSQNLSISSTVFLLFTNRLHPIITMNVSMVKKPEKPVRRRPANATYAASFRLSFLNNMLTAYAKKPAIIKNNSSISIHSMQLSPSSILPTIKRSIVRIAAKHPEIDNLFIKNFLKLKTIVLLIFIL